MVEAGVFAADDRLELIDGEILDMSPIGSPHDSCVSRLMHLFAGLSVARGAVVQAQGADSGRPTCRAPSPTLALLPLARRLLRRRVGPFPHEVLLVVEVADQQRALRPHDQAAGLRPAPVCPRRDRRPACSDRRARSAAVSPHGYRRPDRGSTVAATSLAPEAFPDVTIAVDDILG